MSRKTRKPQLATIAPDPNAPILSIPNAAKFLGIHVLAVRRAIRERELPYIPIGRGFYLHVADLMKWVESRKRVAAA